MNNFISGTVGGCVGTMLNTPFDVRHRCSCQPGLCSVKCLTGAETGRQITHPRRNPRTGRSTKVQLDIPSVRRFLYLDELYLF